MYFDLPVNDSSDYGWGKGRERPVYPCTGMPQGLFKGKNRSTGWASTAGKYASAFALGARIYAKSDSAYSRLLREKAEMAYRVGLAHPGVCQTAPGKSPYFYEEDNWVDDMELGAAELAALTGERRYFTDAIAYAKQEPVTPWMGADTANHYQWFPWHNNGHYETWRFADARRDAAARRTMADDYLRGLDGVSQRADNGFRIGIPFIWCSNNLMTSFATQAMLYRRMTGDNRYRQYEQSAIDWLFGVNPWGVSMMVVGAMVGLFAKPRIRTQWSLFAWVSTSCSAGCSMDPSIDRYIRTSRASHFTMRTNTPDSTPVAWSTMTTLATTPPMSRSWMVRRI